MIKKYSVENFKSIKLKEIISFEATSYKNRDVKLLDNNLLPILVIYGPNGGGKSAFIESFFFLTNYLINSNTPQAHKLFNDLKSFKHINRLNEPITWEIEIISKNKNEYKYFLSINEKEGMINESLFYKEYNEKKDTREKLVFERNGNIAKMGASFANEEIKLSGFLPINSFLMNANSFLGNKIINDFCKNLLSIHVINNIFLNPFLSMYGQTQYNFDKNILIKEKEKFLKIFQELDINIIDINIKTDIIGQETLIFKKIIDNKEVELPFKFESEGTKKIIQLLTIFIKGMHNDELFVIDELDSRLHTKLLGYLIDMFNYQNGTNSQLIFTSHDIGTLSTDYFREDEIYFAALNESNFTDIICLSEFGSDIRTKSSISNKYLKGDLGYDPYIQRAKEKYGK